MITPFAPVHSFVAFWLDQQLCERKVRVRTAADEIRPYAFSDKIKEMIESCDFVICDLSGPRPNVTFELGIAHALLKPVVLISGDDPNTAPSDVRHLDIIWYSRDLKDFAVRMEAAVDYILAVRFTELLQKCSALVEEINKTETQPIVLCSKEEFVERAWSTPTLKQSKATWSATELGHDVLPLAAADGLSQEQQSAVFEWIKARK
ncbi:hypothetical protein IT575_03220 [bacterium]|nr:hypothetical protein [bacterium]